MEAAWRGKPLDDEVSRRILESAVKASGLPAQVVSPGSPLDDSLIAYIIASERGGPDGALGGELEKAAAAQLARELIAAVIRFLRTHGLTQAPELGDLSVEVPVTGEPPTNNDLAVRGFKMWAGGMRWV